MNTPYIFTGTEKVLGFDGGMSGLSNSDLAELSAKLERAGMNPHHHISMSVNRNIDYDYYPMFKARRKFTYIHGGKFDDIAFNTAARQALLPQ